MHNVFLGIGGNIGNKQKNFAEVYAIIENQIGTVIKKSAIYETPPWGFRTNNVFWNSVIEIETPLSPEKLLGKIHSIEKQLGRQRNQQEGYSSRPMDIDILYFDELYIETEKLIIPHPRIQLRRFVLVPLNEIAPNFKHPLLRLTTLQLLENCKDESVIKKVHR